MRASQRRVLWVSGIAWIVSWFLLGLEIFRWHHVTRTLRLNPPKAPPGYPEPRPGIPLLSVLAGSTLAPIVFIAAATAAHADRLPWRRRRHTDATGQHAR